MEEKLLGRAVEYHGPDFLRQLQLEQQNLPPNIFLHLQRHRPHPPEIDDPQFIMNVRRFISKKADMLFKPMENKDVKTSINTLDDDEDSYAKMPPLETFMGIDPNACRRHFFNSVKAKDLVIGIVTSILDSGLVLQLLCMDDDKNRDIDSLRITAFVPVKEIPKMFPTQNPTEGYQVQDFIRGVVVNVNVESENILVSLSDRELQEREGTMPHLGLIHEEDFPVQYRRKLHIRGLTFDELLNSIMGFTNPGNVKYLLRNLNQGEDVSMMRGLHRLKIPEKEYAESLKKQQSQKMAYKNVAQGIAFFKEGRQTEAMQQLNKALQIDPRNVEALVARGALYANNESYNRAIEDFEEALQVNKKHPNAIKYMHETLLAKGKGHEDSGDWDDAEECYKKALDLQPDSVEAQESIRYVKYRKESGKGKTRQDKKSYDEKSKTPPYQSTTVTLKKLIDEDTKSRKKKSDDIKQESRRKSRKYSSSSSSSGSSSSSRSRSRSRSEVKSRSSRQRSRSPRKGLSKARSRSPSLRERDINQRSRSPRKRSTSPRKRSRSPRKRSPSPRKRSRSPVTSKSREYKTEDPVRRQSEEYSRRVSEQDGSSHHFNFFKKDERIPFLDSSPQKEETVEHVVKDVLENKPIDDEDDDLYGDSIYEKPDRNFPVVDVKHPSQADIQHYEHGFDNQKNEAYYGSPGLRGSHLQVKEAKEVSVTPTRDEINDRLGLEDISPDIHDDRRNDDVKYRSSLDGKGPKRSLHISKAWSPNERYESKGRRYSPDYERDSPRRRDERESNRYESDRGRRSSYDRRSYERDYEKSDRDGERRVISVGKKSGGNAERRYDDETRLDEYQERRSIVVGKKQKMRSPQEAREPEYISHVISAQAIERKNECSSRRRSRSRSGSRSRHRSRSKSRSRRSKSKDRRRSRSRSSKRRYERDSPKRDYDYNRQSSRGGERRSSRDRERRSKDRDVYSGRRDEKSSREDQYQRSRSGSRERRESREHGFRSPGYQRKETEKRSSTRDDHNETDDKYYMHAIKTEEPRTFQEERRIVAGDSSKRRFVEEKEETKPLTSDLADIFADLPPPRAKKNPITMAFSTYVPRAVKLKQYQPPETSLNPESRPPPESVLPVYQQSRNKNVTEIKDQVFSMTKTLDIMKHDEKMIDFSARGITVAKPRQEYRRSRSKSPYERSYNSKSHKSRSRSPDNKRSITVHRVVDKRSSSRSPVRSSSKRRDTRSRSHSREKLSNKKRYGRSRSRSKSPERKRQYSGRKPSKRSESRSRSRSSSKGRSGRHVFPAAKTMKRSRSKSVGKYDKKKDSKRSYSRSRSPEGERRSISVKKSINKDDKSKDKVPDIKIPTIKSKWDSPEEKSSRWDETHKSNTKSLEMPLIISSAQEHAFACAAASMISSSPPPHRQMKPEEKKKMEEKWKALEVKDEIDNAIILEEMTDIQIKKSVEASAREIENQLKSGSDGKKNNDTTKESLKAGKKMKDHGMRSKWDSDSSSSSSRSRGRRRSSSSSSSSSRSRSREKDSKKSSSKRSTGSAGKVKSDSGKKEKSSEQRVFWFHKKEVTGFSTGKKSKKSSQKSKRSESRSPKRKKSRSRSPLSSKKKLTKDDINKNPFKTKTKTSHTVTSSSVVMPKVITPKPVKVEKEQNDSLQEMEKFLNKLKSDKKMKDQQRTFKK